MSIDDYPVFGADINHAISIVGNGIENTIINGNSTRLFNVNAGTVASPIVISGLTITGGGGDDGGGIYVSA